jgi:hypothetical protein
MHNRPGETKCSRIVRILNELMLPSVIPIFGEKNFIFQD